MTATIAELAIETENFALRDLFENTVVLDEKLFD